MNSAFQAFQGPAETHISIAATGGIPLLPCFHNAKPAERCNRVDAAVIEREELPGCLNRQTARGNVGDDPEPYSPPIMRSKMNMERVGGQ
jgi:hypothetical protein